MQQFWTIFFFTTLLLAISGCSEISIWGSSSEPTKKPKLTLKSSKKSADQQNKVLLDHDPPHVYPELSKEIKAYCKKIDQKFKRYKWGKSGCEEFDWNHVRNSVKGDPLMWVTYGNEKLAKQRNYETTIVLCGVHGDEITPIKFCFDILHYMQEKHDEFDQKLIVISPIVNPDSFFKRRPTRSNANGVDINRNFPTKDWYKKAQKLWRRRYGRDPRRNPGIRPMSEPEVLYQVNLMKRYRPDKIISVHAPLTLLDYDGPGDHSRKTDKKGLLANQLLIQMSKKASGYKVINYPFFPGSLGNYAGNERKIPTYTVELPTSDYTKTNEYWGLFRDAIRSAFLHDFSDPGKIALKKSTKKGKKTN